MCASAGDNASADLGRRADAMDVYVTTKGKVRLLDFNPFGWTTQPLLFSWEELLTRSSRHETCAAASTCKDARPAGESHSTPELRLMLDESHLQGGAAGTFGAPADVHMHLHGLSWNAVMAKLQAETKELGVSTVSG